MTKDITRGIEYIQDSEGNIEVNSIQGSLKMNSWDYLASLSPAKYKDSLYEVQFKNTHKGLYLNSEGLAIKKGDIVVVESQPGIDIGVVTLGPSMTKKRLQSAYIKEGDTPKKILRIPNGNDISKWQEAIALEHTTMIQSRQIAASLGLEMKIGDVEYQADKLKAIFYYIADGRVDFRELIKVLAEKFRLRVEMKQIGARQEAGRIGGIGSCGRELCCSSWQTCFSSVSINSARVQDLSPNPQKLAGQCGKLKCCLNYEVEVYEDAQESLPKVKSPLEALDGSYHLIKIDSLRKIMWFSTDPQNPSMQIPLSAIEVENILKLNAKGQKPETLLETKISIFKHQAEPSFENVVGQDSLTRFDKNKVVKKDKKNNKHNNLQQAETKNTENNSSDSIAGTETPKNNRRFRPNKKKNRSKDN